jgi:hypothetical protein
MEFNQFVCHNRNKLPSCRLKFLAKRYSQIRCAPTVTYSFSVPLFRSTFSRCDSKLSYFHLTTLSIKYYHSGCAIFVNFNVNYTVNCEGCG